MRAYIGLFVVVLAVRVQANPAGDKLSADAAALAKSGDYIGAAAKFREAYVADPRPELICNIGIAYQKAKELPRAQLFLSRCLIRGTSLEPAFVDAVRKVLASTEDKLKAGDFTPIDIFVRPEAATITIKEFGLDESFVGARLVYLPFGAHEITVHADGYVDQTRQLETATRSQSSVTIELEKIHETVPPDAGVIGIDAAGSATPPPPPIPAAPQPPSRALPIAVSLGAVALGVGSLFVYLSARSHANNASHVVPVADYKSERDAAVSMQHISWGLGVAAIVAVGASVYLWRENSRARSHLEVSASGSGASVSLSGSW